jgi:fatty acid desaturase
MKTGMKNRLWKETRAILPAWIITLALMASGRLILEYDFGQVWFVLFAYVLGAQFVGAIVFGHEFNDNTVGLLLTRSISRPRIYLEKVVVLAIALIGLMTAMALGIWSSVPATQSSMTPSGYAGLMLVVVLPALTAWCSGPLYELDYARHAGRRRAERPVALDFGDCAVDLRRLFASQR